MPESVPSVSIIVTCYNYGRFLPDALNSIRAQSFSDWECIIVDDGSTDNSAAVAMSFAQNDARFAVVQQEHSGISVARNTALGRVRGRYIQLLDADDAIAPEKIRLQSEYLDAHPEADIVYGSTEYFNESINNRSRSRTDIAVPDHSERKDACGATLVPQMLRENFLVISGPLYRASTAARVGLFATELRSYEDWQYWFRFALAGACFHHRPIPGTETWIRYGHSSLMKNHRQMNAAGIQLRHYFRAHAQGSMAIYNSVRLLRLRVRQLLLRLKG
jgi:glycosyltransferase involved in cell wall biosynthesis